MPARPTPETRKALDGLAEELLDDQENQQMLAQEREPDEPNPDPMGRDYPCPDFLWQGAYAVVAETLEQHTWPVWLGTYMALMARVHRGICCEYHKTNLYGMPWTLMVGHTGSNKGLAARVCRDLMPSDYLVRKGISSGPALVEILAKVQYEKGEVIATTSRPALLATEEWTSLLRYSGLSGSVLVEDLCEIYHSRYPWNVTKTRKSGEGGDVNIENPTLSILGLTTPSGFSEGVTPRMIRQGFINRHLILPCTTSPELVAWRDPGALNGKPKRVHPDLLLGCYPPPSWREEWEVERIFAPAAGESMGAWIRDRVILPKQLYARTEPPLSHLAAVPRIDRHAFLVAMSYALATKNTQIEQPHVAAARYVCDVAIDFTMRLVGDIRGILPVTKTYLIELDERIIEKVRTEVGISRERVKNSLRRHAPMPEIGERIQQLINHKFLIERRLNGTKKRGLWVL